MQLHDRNNFSDCLLGLAGSIKSLWCSTETDTKQTPKPGASTAKHHKARSGIYGIPEVRRKPCLRVRYKPLKQHAPREAASKGHKKFKFATFADTTSVADFHCIPTPTAARMWCSPKMSPSR